MPDYDMLAVGGGFAGSMATLTEAGKNGAWPGASRWTKPFPRLNYPPETAARIERRFE